MTSEEKSGKNNSEPAFSNLVLFDGVCLLCEGFVKFLLKKDKKGHFHFAPLQSEFSENILLSFGESGRQLDSVCLISEAKLYKKSQAVLKMISILGFPWSILLVFRVLPDSFLDAIYDKIARNRYGWFGKRKDCLLPDPKWANRFLK